MSIVILDANILRRDWVFIPIINSHLSYKNKNIFIPGSSCSIVVMETKMSRVVIYPPHEYCLLAVEFIFMKRLNAEDKYFLQRFVQLPVGYFPLALWRQVGHQLEQVYIHL